MRLKAEEVLDRLINIDKIQTVAGQITFNLGDINIVVKQKDVVGNIMQEWLEGWFKKNEVDYAVSSNTQMPPDFYLNPDDRTVDLLEVKAFNYEATPGFDIADFKAYEREIVVKPFMLHAKYLIFGYKMSPTGVVTINKVWLENVWNICRPSAKWPLNLQVKKNVVHKIRPGKWFSSAQTQFSCFNNLEDFLSAVEEVVYKNIDTHDDANDWRDKMVASYASLYGKYLDIPRWQRIKSQYVKPKSAKKASKKRN